MSDNFQKLFRSGEDCLPDWKRVRPIATLMSSDNKKLIETDEDGNPTPNSIGYRYSWIKMSQPSIESLRQAFLDHESRIILPEDITSDKHPFERTKQARIQSISIRNVAFLADQEIFFSRNMNCVIGGRGSGKSTLLEYLRILFGRDQIGDIDSDTEERIKRIRDTLNAESELKVNWISADGVEDQIIWRNDRIEVLNREDLPDPETFFRNLPIRFYSQQQLNRLTESKLDDGSVRQAQRLLELVDGFNKKELDVLSEQERTQKHLIQDAFEKLRRAKNFEADLNRLKQEYQELDRQWKARSEIQEEATKHQRLKAESRYLDTIFETSVNQFSEIADLAENAANSHVPFTLEGSPHESWFQQLDKKVKIAKDELAANIRNSVETFKQDIERFKTSDPEWEQINNSIEEADVKFREACQSKGLTTDDVGRLEEISQLRAQKLEAIDNVTTEINSLREAAGNPNELTEQLHQIWGNQYEKRVQAADIANELAVLGDGPQRFIEVTAKYQQDKKNSGKCGKDSLHPMVARVSVEIGRILVIYFTISLLKMKMQNHHGSS